MAEKGGSLDKNETSVDDGTVSAAGENSDGAELNRLSDPDLDDLLDSALQDFKSNKDVKEAKSSSAASEHETSASGGTETLSSDAISAAFAEEFSDELASQFEQAMKSFLSQDPRMMEQIEKLAEAAGNAGDSPEAQQQFAATLSQTLADLTHNAEGLQLGEEELNQALGGVAAEGQGEDFMPMMQGLMQTLLSKDILYPSLKEISSKYPAYLAENESSIKTEELDRYRKQYDLMTSICTLFEEEEVDDTQEMKSLRFEKLMDQMQQMQELGQPPKDIVGEMAPGLEFDENGLPRLPGVGNPCNLM